jgi:hypothetical protein
MSTKPTESNPTSIPIPVNPKPLTPAQVQITQTFANRVPRKNIPSDQPPTLNVQSPRPAADITPAQLQGNKNQATLAIAHDPIRSSFWDKALGWLAVAGKVACVLVIVALIGVAVIYCPPVLSALALL